MSKKKKVTVALLFVSLAIFLVCFILNYKKHSENQLFLNLESVQREGSAYRDTIKNK